MLDAVERRGERFGVAVVELNVVAGGGAGVKSDRLAYDLCDGLGLGFADCFALRTIFAAVQQLVSQLMYHQRELLGGRQTRADADVPPRETSSAPSVCGDGRSAAAEG